MSESCTSKVSNDAKKLLSSPRLKKNFKYQVKKEKKKREVLFRSTSS